MSYLVMIVGLSPKEHQDVMLENDVIVFYFQGSDVREGIKCALSELGEGDTFLVYAARPIVRSTLDLLRLISATLKKGAHFRSLTEEWCDTTLPAAQFAAGLAGFEREIIKARTTAGRAAAIDNGIVMGRPPKLSNGQKAVALDMYSAGIPQIEIARAFNLSPATVSTMVREHGVATEENEDAA